MNIKRKLDAAGLLLNPAAWILSLCLLPMWAGGQTNLSRAFSSPATNAQHNAPFAAIFDYAPPGMAFSAVVTSGTNIVPQANLSLAEDPTNLTVTLTPIPHQSGTVGVDVTGTLPDWTNTVPFQVFFLPCPPLVITPAFSSPATNSAPGATFEGLVAFSPTGTVFSLDITAGSSILQSFDVSPVNATNAQVTLEPKTNKSGWVSVDLTGANDCATNTVSFDVYFRTHSPVLGTLTNVTMLEDGTNVVSFTVSDADTVLNQLTLSAVSSNTTLIATSDMTFGGTGGSRTLTLRPKANENGAATIVVTLSDPDGNSVSKSFTLTVQPVNDRPTLTGLSNASTPDNVSVTPFTTTTIGDVDQGKPDNEYLSMVVTLEATTGDLDPVLARFQDGTTTYTASSELPADLTTLLRSVVVIPVSNAVQPTASASVRARVVVVDTSLSTTGTLTLTITSLNDPPTVSGGLNPAQMTEGQTVYPFYVTSINDVDINDDLFTLRVELANPGQSSLGSFSPNPPTVGPASLAVIQAYLAGVSYTAASGQMSNITESIQFRYRVTDGFGGTSTTVQAMTLYQVQNPPQISGIPVETVPLQDKPVAYTPFPTVYVSDSDMGGLQLLDAVLTQSTPALGSFSQSLFTGVTAAQLTALLRAVRYTPNPGAIPIDTSANTILTLAVTDSGGQSAQNNNLTLHITSVNNAPQILNVPAVEQQPVLIPPAEQIKPFTGLGLRSDDPSDLLFTITLDNAAKGTLTNLGSFVSTGGGVYQMTGTTNAILQSLTNLAYRLNPAYNFPADDPGGTTFTLKARDFALLTTEKILYIQVQDAPRNHLVVRAVDDGQPGSLGYALAHAGNNDVVTFALPSYPATIRMPGSVAATLARNLTLKGPGANLLTLSGDGNGDGTPDRQLFRIASRVTMEGLTFAEGVAECGGAIAVESGGTLSLRNCAVVDSLAMQYGGGIDVNGGFLTLDGCFIGRNRLDEDTGMSGAGVSIYSDHSVTIRNTTFAANEQANAGGDGGGALVVQNVTSGYSMNAFLTHCTFAENTDASGRASAVLAIGFGARLKPQHCVFADFSARNLNVAAAGECLSLGGNLCDDSTRITLIQEGQSEEVYLLDHLTDLTMTDPLLAPLNPAGDPLPYYGLLEGSLAIEHGVGSTLAIDQRGVLRLGVPDSGAIEFNALRRLVINEVQFSNGRVNFIELYVPRHSTPVDLAPFSLFVDGVKVHEFVNSVIVGTNALFAAGVTNDTVVNPGFGFVVAFTNSPFSMTGALNPTPVVRPSLPAGSTTLESRGDIAIGIGGEQEPIARQTYLGVFMNPETGTNVLNIGNNSISLAPQFRGFALVPHSFILAGLFSGVDPAIDITTFPESPGEDATGTPFGQNNAEPLALADTFTTTEDDLSSLDVLANDFDSDGNDRLVVVDVSPASAPGSGDTAITNSVLGATVVVDPAAVPLRGARILFDPRAALLLQQLSAGVEIVDTFHYEVIDIGSWPVEAYGVSGSNTSVAATRHRLASGDQVTLTGASVSAYNGTFVVTVLDEDTFEIPVLYDGVASPRGSWVTTSPRMPTSRSEAAVTVRVIGVNDPPVAVADFVTNVTEASTVRVMVRPELAGTALAFPGDPVPPPDGSLQNVLTNDTDIDTDDSWETLRVVGILGDVHPILDYSGVEGAMPVAVHAPGHGLTSGTRVLIANYGGHASYNGYHTITVVDADTFTIPNYYSGNHAVKGVWAILNEANRYNATTPAGAAVTLTLRSDPREDNFVYKASVSAFLDGLAEGEVYVDRFWYAVEDRHGAIGLGPVDVEVTGLNDTPVGNPDADSLAVLDPLVTVSNTLDEVLSGGLDLMYRLPPASGTAGRTDLFARDLGGTLPGTLALQDFFVTDEDTPLDIPAAAALANDTDIDRLDVLNVVAAGSPSRDQASVSLNANVITYDPRPSGALQALARDEWRIDTFSLVVSDGLTAGTVTSLVAVLVVGVNDTPTAFPDKRTTNEDEVFVFDSRTNDVEIDINSVIPDDRLRIVAVSNMPNPGLALVNLTPTSIVHDATASWLLNQLADWQVFTNVFNYTLTDNSFLFVVDDDFYLPLGTANRLLDVLANDRDFTDSEGRMTIIGVGPTLNGGTVGIVSNGQVLVYSPPPGHVGDDYFRYTIRNDAGDERTGRVMVRSVFPPVNGILHAAADRYTVAAGETIVMNVTTNDGMMPLSGSGLTVLGVVTSSIAGQPILTNNTFVYTADDGLTPLAFTYVVGAGGASTACADVVVSIVDRRGALDIRDDAFSVLPGSLNNELAVLDNDGLVTEATDNYRIGAILDPALHGTLTTNTAGTRLIYTPEADFIGIEQIRYGVTDRIGGTGTGTVSITVGCVEAVPDFFKLEAANTNGVGLDVLANDRLLPAVRGTLTILDAFPADPSGTPNIGTLAVAGSSTSLLFTASGVVGQRDFRYVVQDVGVPARTATGTVSLVTVNPGAYANPDTYRVRGGGSGYVLDVLANDISYPNTDKSYSILSIGTGADAPSAGGIVLIVSNRLVYTPATGFFGEETFTYRMSDSVQTDITHVTVSVRRGDLFANEDRYTVFYEWDDGAGAALSFELPVTLNDRIQPSLGQVFQIVALGAGANAPNEGGSVEIAPGGLSLIYRPGIMPSPEFTETFTYEIADGTDRRASCPVHVRVRNRQSHLVAVTQADAYTVARNSSNNVMPLLENDFVRPGTANGWTLTAVSATLYGGTVSIYGSTVKYTPPAGFVGLDTFTYGVSDGLGGTGSATVGVRVGDLPVLPSRFVALAGSIANDLDVLANDVLSGAYAEEYVLHGVFGATTGGTLALSASNTVLYTPDPTYAGAYPYVEHFQYRIADDAAIAVTGVVEVTVHDAASGRSTTNVTLVVEGRNDPPEIANDTTNAPITDKQTALPFTGVTITEVDEQLQERIDVLVSIDDPAKGRLFNLEAFVDIGSGRYSLTNVTAAAATATIRQLVYIPVENRITVPTTETVFFTISVTDHKSAPVVDTHSSLAVTAVNDIPVILGARAGQRFYYKLPVQSFATVTLTEVDDLTLQPLRVTVGVQEPTHGVMTNLGSFVAAGGGIYVATNITAANATLQLRAMEFTVGTNIVPAGGSLVTHMQLMVEDGFAPPVVDTNTSVVAFNAYGGTLQPAADSTKGTFGLAVDTIADYAVVGAPNASTGGVNSGTAFVYRHVPGSTNVWTEWRQLMPATVDTGDRFGRAVSISDTAIAVGAPEQDTGGGQLGSVYLFRRHEGGTNNWGEWLRITPTNTIGVGRFGLAVALSGDTLAVGAPDAMLTGGVTNAGAVFVFGRHQGGPNAWGEIMRWSPTGTGSAEADFGWSVALSGDTLIVGAPEFNSATATTNREGAVYQFERNQGGSNNWGLAGTLTAAETNEATGFGWAVAVNGTRMAVGAPSMIAGTVAGAGRVYLYGRDGVGGAFAYKMQADRRGDSERKFGYSVALDGELLLAGAPENGSLPNVGAAYLYADQTTNGGLWTLVEKFTRPAGSVANLYGRSVGLRQGTAVVGAPASLEGAVASNKGHAFFYRFDYRVLDGLTDLAPRESWNKDAFGEETGNPWTLDSLWGGLADPDGDGVRNDVEYAFGGDPNTAGDVIGVTLARDNEGHWLISYVRRSNDPAIVFTLEASPDLATWYDWESFIWQETTTPLTWDTELVNVVVDSTDALTTLFFRIRAAW